MWKFYKSFNENQVAFFIAFLGFFVYSIQDIFIKLLGTNLHPAQLIIIFSLSMFFWLNIFSFFMKIDDNEFSSEQLPYLLSFGIFGGLNQVCIIYSFTLLPLEDVYSLAALSPIIVSLLISLISHANIPFIHFIYLLFGCLGALLIINPTFSTVSVAHLFAFLAVIFGVLRDVIIRISGATLNRYRMQFSLTIFSIIFAILVFGTPKLNEMEKNLHILSALFLIGILFFIGLRLQIIALSRGEVQYPSFARYSQVVFGIISSFFIFQTQIGFLDIIGATLIIISGYRLLLK